ncbi:S4 domain-containing protein [Candidatus Vidania fulgoroideorum]
MKRFRRKRNIIKYGSFLNGFFLKKSIKKTSIFNRKNEYSSQLFDRQKIKKKYIIKERQYKRILNKTKSSNKSILFFMEKRMDNIIYISGFARTRFESKQIINHKYFLLNKKNHNIPSTLLKKGDNIKLKKKFFNYNRIIDSVIIKRKIPKWLHVSFKKMCIEVINDPY